MTWTLKGWVDGATSEVKPVQINLKSRRNGRRIVNLLPAPRQVLGWKH